MIRIVEGVQQYLKFLKEHLADCAAAAVETSHSVAQISESLPAIVRTMNEIHAEVSEMNGRLNRYIADQAKQDGKVARLEKNVSEIRAKLPPEVANG